MCRVRTLPWRFCECSPECRSRCRVWRDHLACASRGSKVQEASVVIHDDAETVPLADLREFLAKNPSGKKKRKKKPGTRTKRDGARPCTKCMHKAIAQCSACWPSLLANFKLPTFSSAQSTANGFEIILRNDTGRVVKLCENCTKEYTSLLKASSYLLI